MSWILCQLSTRADGSNMYVFLIKFRNQATKLLDFIRKEIANDNVDKR